MFDKEYQQGLVTVDGKAIAIGAIKQVYTAPFDKANVANLASDYHFEIGYIFVIEDEQFRGKGIATTICVKLLEQIGSNKVFATTENADTNRMRSILVNLGFKRVGETYRGEETQKTIGLFILN